MWVFLIIPRFYAKPYPKRMTIPVVACPKARESAARSFERLTPRKHMPKRLEDQVNGAHATKAPTTSASTPWWA
mgnify:CR=1 FL=1